MKKLYLFAALATMLAACSENDLTAEKQVVQQNAEEGAVVFDAYQSRGTTRAGKQGTMDLDLLKAPDAGFGVFGYYTNNEGYSELARPDFMYNQKVTFSGSWTYAPIKYWPNEFGQDAESERIDYLTFFAYAPYVDSDSKTGKVDPDKDDYGIVGMTRNTTLGDPLVKYVANFKPAEVVDLCWGVAAADFQETVTNDYAVNNISQNSPYIDVIKPKSNSKIKFDFKHALAQMNVQIDTDVDVESHAGTDADSKTRIYVRSVTFEGFTDRGTLNLNSKYVDGQTPIWYDFSGNGNLSTAPITIYDQRYDGREGVENVFAPAEAPLGLNSKIIQSKPYITTSGFESHGDDPGVTHTPVNLFDDATVTTPILVIPNNQDLKVKVVYDVETYDPNLAEFLSDGKTHGSTIENAISKKITLTGTTTPMKLEAGKMHTIKLHLGLTSVKFDATVSPWTNAASEGEADLPINNGIADATAVADGDPATVVIPASGVTNAIFSASGFTASESSLAIAATGFNTSPTLDPSTTVDADAAGNASVKYTLAANTTVNKNAGTITITGAGSKNATLNVVQEAAALGLKINTPAAGAGTSFEIGTTATATSAEMSAGTYTITRKRGGVTVNLVKDDTPEGDQFKVTGAANAATIDLGTGTGVAQAGDVYTITAKIGDAAAETVSFTVAPVPAYIKYVTPAPSSPVGFTTFADGTDIKDNAAKLYKTSDNTEITTGGGTIEYSVNDNTYFQVTSAGVLQFKGTWAAGDTRTVTVTATVTPGVNYSYASTSVSYTLTVNANN